MLLNLIQEKIISVEMHSRKAIFFRFIFFWENI